MRGLGKVSARFHVGVALVAIGAAAGFLWLAKPRGMSLAEFLAWQPRGSALLLLAFYAAAWIAVFVGCWASRRPRVLRPLGTTTCALGIASTVALALGWAIGLLALPCILAGLVTGTLVLIAEARHHEGNSFANLIGLALLVGGIVFLMS